jgi:DNA recombination protein RmuC
MQMRATVDEKLHATLETAPGRSFKQVADRLEQVHKGLGEMQTLAQGVGDLKRVLTNVKTRGMFGEVQLAALLEQVFTPEQYAPRWPPCRAARAGGVRHPPAGRGSGPQDGGAAVAADRRQVPARGLRAPARRAGARRRRRRRGGGKALECASGRGRTHRDKYLEPPHTTDFRHPVPAHRGPVRRGAAPPRA